MPLFIDHFHGGGILTDPQKITNQFSWLLILMIASIKAMNGDRCFLRNHFFAHERGEAVACFTSVALSGHLQAIEASRRPCNRTTAYSRPKERVQSDACCALETH